MRCPSCSSSPIAPFAVIATFFIGPGEGDGNTEFTPFVSASFFFLAFGAEVGSEAVGREGAVGSLTSAV